jgi:hypothetical protein
MRVKFASIVKTTRKTCGNNITVIYTVPCELDKSIAGFMTSLGSPKFDLNTIKFLHIESGDYTIKGKLDKTNINLSVPKKSKNIGIFGTKQKELENNIARWLEHRLGISIN